MPTPRPRGLRRFLAVLIVVYVAKQIVVALLTPPFTGHDEVAHFAYIRTLAGEQRVPTLWTDNMPFDFYRYHAFSIQWDDPEYSPLPTAVHPPLYYALMAPLYRALADRPPETIQYVLRCASIPFGVAIVMLASLLTRTLFPRDPFLNVTVPTVVAFQPQVSYVAAMVNNDALAIALYTVALYVLVVILRDGATPRRSVWLGAAVGLAVLAKASALVLLALAPAAIWVEQRSVNWRRIASLTVLTYAVALTVTGPWLWFMLRTYGEPTAFRALASTQPDFTRTEATFFGLLLSGRFVVERWMETWGEFGWRLIHVSPMLIAALGVTAAVGVAGLVIEIVRYSPRDERETWRLHALVILGAACATGYLATVQFGVRFVLTQARYFFPVVDAVVLLLAFGLRSRIPQRWHGLAQAVVVFAAIAMNITVYTAYVVPYWYFR